jgi:hypothetical protein
MSHPKDIELRDENGKLNGYCEVLEDSGKWWVKGVFVNDTPYGYHYDDQMFSRKGYWLNGCKISIDNKQGYCYTWNTKEVEQS